MKISVIITAYNRERTIEACVRSVASQNFDDAEIIAVDDGSSDCTADILKGLAAEIPALRVFTQANAGVGAARNAGLAAAAGDYVTYLDSDDTMTADALKRMSSAIEEYRAVRAREDKGFGDSIKSDDGPDMLIYEAAAVYPDGSIKPEPTFRDGRGATRPGILTPAKAMLSNPCPWDRLVKKSLYKKAFGDERPFPEGIWYEDYATMPILTAAARSIYYIDDKLINYSHSEGSIMRGEGANAHYADIFAATDRLRKALCADCPAEMTYLAAEHLLISGGKRYLACGDREGMRACAEYMRKFFADWADNCYIKLEPAKKRALARLIYKNHYGLLKILGK